MITAELAQGRLIQLEQNFAQLLRFRIASCETLPVNLTQRTDEGVSVFCADFAVGVAVAVGTCLDHADLHCARSRQHPPAAIKLQSRRAREIPLCTVHIFSSVRLPLLPGGFPTISSIASRWLLAE